MSEPIDGLVEHVPIAQLHPHPKNARAHDIPTIRESLRTHGQYRTIVARAETREILAGHGTWEAAKQEGFRTIRVEWRSVPDDDQARKIVAVDNRANDLAGYDPEALKELLTGLPDLEGTGYTAGDLDALLAKLEPNFTEPAAPAPAPEIEAITRPGDRIVLGDHVLVCGDARDEHAWQDLTREDDDRPQLIWTDPPYGVDAGALRELIYVAFGWALEYTADQAAFYCCHADTMRPHVQGGLEDAGWAHHQTVIWVKDHLVIGRQDYQWRHEPILYGWRASGTHRWHGEFDKTTVMEGATVAALEALSHADLVELTWTLLEQQPGTVARFARPQIARFHPTTKPVELVAGHIRNSTEHAASVVDMFAGSGSTILAAEQTGRRARRDRARAAALRHDRRPLGRAHRRDRHASHPPPAPPARPRPRQRPRPAGRGPRADRSLTCARSAPRAATSPTATPTAPPSPAARPATSPSSASRSTGPPG
jgi:16S rRNA G966 N2-methylase RsmD